MAEKEKIKGFEVPKRLSQQAKLVGLTYNTFFIFIIVFAILLMIGSFFGLVGALICFLLSAIAYGVLFFLQSKLGSKELGKMKNDFYNPIRFIKVSVPFSRLFKM